MYLSTYLSPSIPPEREREERQKEAEQGGREPESQRANKSQSERGGESETKI